MTHSYPAWTWPSTRHVAGAAALACLALLGACASRTANRTFEQRFLAMPAQDDVIAAGDWYRPVARVAGGPGGSLRIGAPRTPLSAARPTADALAGFAPVVAAARAWDSYAVVVVQDARVVFEHYETPGGPEFRFDSQSMHRGLLALVLGAAIADGKIPSLDTHVADYLPEWRGDGRRAVTIRDLVYYQSGFIDPPYAAQRDSPALQLFIGTDSEALVLGQQLVTAPGLAFRGNAVDAQILGLVIERATRRPYADFLSAHLWKPIGASTAYVRLDHAGGHGQTFCCIQATARDWARVGQLMLDHGRVGDRQVLPGAWIDQMLTPSPLNPSFGTYWLLKPTPLTPKTVPASQAPTASTPFEATDVFYAGGRGGQRVYVVPSLRAVVVRFGHIRNDFDDGAFLNPILHALGPVTDGSHP